jgi:hypothetical protein
MIIYIKLEILCSHIRLALEYTTLNFHIDEIKIPIFPLPISELQQSVETEQKNYEENNTNLDETKNEVNKEKKQTENNKIERRFKC